MTRASCCGGRSCASRLLRLAFSNLDILPTAWRPGPALTPQGAVALGVHALARRASLRRPGLCTLRRPRDRLTRFLTLSLHQSSAPNMPHPDVKLCTYILRPLSDHDN